MPPGPLFNWYCVLHSAVDICVKAAEYRTTQAGLRVSPLTAGRKRKREDVQRETRQDSGWTGRKHEDTGLNDSVGPAKDLLRPNGHSFVEQGHPAPSRYSTIPTIQPLSGLQAEGSQTVSSKDAQSSEKERNSGLFSVQDDKAEDATSATASPASLEVSPSQPPLSDVLSRNGTSAKLESLSDLPEPIHPDGLVKELDSLTAQEQPYPENVEVCAVHIHV
ncbi:hypothetical protein NEOLEDRAFT_1242081, partial [Neolentinus lepideus HHB14362 ss-1]